MAGPWEQYQQPAEAKPWEQYAKPSTNEPYGFDQRGIPNDAPAERMAPSPAAQPSASTWQRALDAASAGAMSVPMVGGAAGLGLKALGKAPLIAEEAGAVAKYARPVMESMKMDSLMKLFGFTAGGAAAGAASQLSRDKTKEMGGGETAQELAGFAGGMATSIPGMAAGAAKRAISNVPAKMLNSTFEKPFAQEGVALTKSTGIPLTPGQESGSKSLLLSEAAARQSFFTADKVLAADQKQAEAAIQRVSEIADKISPRDLSKSGVGERLQDAMTAAVKNIDGLRDKQASIDYGEVRNIANGKPIINYKNTVEELKKIIAENKGVVSDDAKKISAQAKTMLDEFIEKPQKGSGLLVDQHGQSIIPPPPMDRVKTVDVEEARRNRSAWSRASKGNGNVFTEVSHDANRTTAARLAKAVSQDFEEASNGPTNVAAALKKANKNFTDFSKSIEYVQSSALGKLLGKDVADSAVTGATANTIPGEKIADRFLKMTPSEAKNVANILNVHNPQILSEAKSFIVRDALKKALDVPVSNGANAVPMSYNKMIKSLPNNEYLSAVGFSNKELQEITDVTAAMRRAGDRSGANTSGTTPMKEFFNMLDAVTGGVKKVAATAAQATVMNKVAKAMTDPNGRQALLTLSKFDPAKQKSKEVMRAIATINSYQGDENPNPPN